MNWRCLLLSWHRIVARRRVSTASEYMRCSCGREYGVNYDVKAILPWDEVSYLYRSPEGCDDAKRTS